MLHASRAGFVVLFIERADFHISNPRESTPFRAPRNYLLIEQLHKELYGPFNEFNNSLKGSFLGFRHEKPAKVPYIDQLYLSNIRVFKCNPNKKNKRWNARAVAQ